MALSSQRLSSNGYDVVHAARQSRDGRSLLKRASGIPFLGYQPTAGNRLCDAFRQCRVVPDNNRAGKRRAMRAAAKLEAATQHYESA